nr:MAG TPA: hypothetical protein [Caudoviricetes sp.]
MRHVLFVGVSFLCVGIEGATNQLGALRQVRFLQCRLPAMDQIATHSRRADRIKNF